MPLHDRTKVDAGIFHNFHSSWIIHLKELLNEGLLPEGYYALAEQHARDRIPDVLTADAPAAYQSRRRTLAIRHVSDHRIVALVEIVSPGNKDRDSSVDSFVNKVDSARTTDIHVLVADLFPPGKHDPRGIHGAIWARYGAAEYLVPSDHPLTLVSYRADSVVEAFVEHLAAGDSLIDMPLFIDADFYVNIPLEATYQAAYRGVPAFWRDVLEGTRSAS
jgi:hypothetical protein